MTKAGYENYMLYLALQRHFSTNYDYFQYNGKVRASVESYEKRKDVFSFEKLSKIVVKDDLEDFFVSHFLENPKEWIKNMSKSNLEKYRAKIKNLPRRFREDLQRIKMEGVGKVMVANGDIPLIHRLCMSNDLELETLILIDWMAPFIDKHAEEVDIPFAFPEHIQRLQKYRPFLKNKLQDNYKYYVDLFKQELVD